MDFRRTIMAGSRPTGPEIVRAAAGYNWRAAALALDGGKRKPRAAKTMAGIVGALTGNP